VTTVVARVVPLTESQVVHFVGPVAFAPPVVAHIEEVVMPMVARIISALGLSMPPVEVAVANPGATSIHDLGAGIEGNSADLPVAVAILSTVLSIPARQDVVLTGHVASPDGDLAPVRDLATKLRGAAADPASTQFVYPDVKGDVSLRILSPLERQTAETALLQCPANMRTTAVRDFADAIRTVFQEEAVVWGSLRAGFFGVSLSAQDDAGPIARAVMHLTATLEERFWSALERFLLAGTVVDAIRLLAALTTFYVRGQIYPSTLGRRLLQLLRSLPPATRQLKLKSRLLSVRTCIQLAQNAGNVDLDDVQLLFEAAARNARGQSVRSPKDSTNDPPSTNAARAAVDAVLTEISAETLTRQIGIPIDTAMASYSLDAITVDSHSEFIDTVSSFYLHLLRHAASVPASVDRYAVEADAIDLLIRTFTREGGIAAAEAEARAATRGGLRFVLNAMTGQWKRDEYAKHVDRVLKEAIDPLCWDARVAFTAEFLKRFAPFLPVEIRNQPSERFARQIECLVRLHVESMNEVGRVLRSM
jgi:hypothetical protein